MKNIRMLAAIGIATLAIIVVAPRSARAGGASCDLIGNGDLWPPNHKLQDAATASCNSCAVASVTVYSDEDDVEPTGSGQFSPDAKLSGSTVRLRGERNGTLDGRVYAVIVRCSDGSCDCCTAVVPHDRSPASVTAVDSQAMAAQTQCDMMGCPAPMGYYVVGDGPTVGPKQ